MDTFRGVVRVRKWPAKRGRPKSRAIQIQNQRFKEAQSIAKTVKGSVMNAAIEQTKGTGLYPRDLLTKMMLAPNMELPLPDGRVLRHRRPQLENVVFQGFRLNLAANQQSPSGQWHRVTWPLAVLDTAGFHAAASPGIVTIPEGVAIMSFAASPGADQPTTGDIVVRLARVTPSFNVLARAFINGGREIGVATGPLVVAEGETYAFETFYQQGRTLEPNGTFFTGTILGAEV